MASVSPSSVSLTCISASSLRLSPTSGHSSAFATLQSRKAYFLHLQRQLSHVFHPNLPPTLSMCAWHMHLASRCFSHSFSQAKMSSTALAAVAKHALRFLTFRGVSDALFGLYMLYWFRCFERMMGPRKCVMRSSSLRAYPFLFFILAPDTFL
jgi:hypothetical protein